MELNPLLTLLGIYNDLFPIFLFSSILTNILYLYVIYVNLIELFHRFKLNIQLTACCFELHVLENLESGYSSFQTAKLVNT